MKRFTLYHKIIVWIGLFAIVFTGCKPFMTDKKQGVTVGSGVVEKKQIHIFQYKIEIVEQLDQLARAYEASHEGVEIKITTYGGHDYQGLIKSEFASGDEPDIFNCGGERELDLWLDELEPLTHQPWIDHVHQEAIEPVTKDGHIYGMPYNMEGYGFLYNKDIFKACGIDDLPTTPEALEDVAKILQQKGYQPFCNGYQEWWVITHHGFNAVLANRHNPEAFIKGIISGQIDLMQDPLMHEWLDLLDITMAYGQEHPFMTSYSRQVETFAKEEAAIIQQGNWIQIQLDKLNPDLNVGLMPIPVGQKDGAVIPYGVPMYWVVNKESHVKDEAKDFLNWLVTSDMGKQYMIEELKFIPAFNHVHYKSKQLGDIASEIEAYYNEGKVYGWSWTSLPPGSPNEMYQFFEQFLNKEINREQLINKIKDMLHQLK